MTSFAFSKCLQGGQGSEEALRSVKKWTGLVWSMTVCLPHPTAECRPEFLNTYRRVFSPLPNYVKAKTLSLFRSLTKELRLKSEKTWESPT